MYHMNSQEKYATLGIDIGSTTVKIAILDEEHNILFSDYERHFANIRETLSELLKKVYDQLQFSQLIIGFLKETGQSFPDIGEVTLIIGK